MSTRRKGARLTRADFAEHRGYFYRRVDESDTRCRVYEPDGAFICTTGVDQAPRVIDDEIARVAAKAMA